MATVRWDSEQVTQEPCGVKMVNGQSLRSILRKPFPVWEKSTVRHQEKLSNPERQGPFFHQVVLQNGEAAILLFNPIRKLEKKGRNYPAHLTTNYFQQ